MRDNFIRYKIFKILACTHRDQRYLPRKEDFEAATSILTGPARPMWVQGASSEKLHQRDLYTA
jgi:hypothetical protein